MIISKNDSRLRRKVRIRKKISGSDVRPRLVVFRSSMHLYAQLVDDLSGTTLVAASTLSLAKSSGQKLACNKVSADLVGKELAKLALAKDIKQVVFDRNGYVYHGRIKAIADGAREGGLEF